MTIRFIGAGAELSSEKIAGQPYTKAPSKLKYPKVFYRL